MSINDETRVRWRRLFSEATRGPWITESQSCIRATSPPTYVMRLEQLSTPHYADLEFCAQAREGWPATLQELEASELRVWNARVALERAENEHRAFAAEVAEREQRQAATFEKALALASEVRAAAAQASAELEQLRREIEPLRTLADAVRAWKRWRHTPNLLSAIERFEVCQP